MTSDDRRRAPKPIAAPGKLVLVGEYAVLDGHPAVVAAVDRLAFSVAPPDPFAASALETDLGRCVAVAARDRGLHVVPAPFAVDTRAFSLGDTKLGLGSSAAAAVVMAGEIVRAASSGASGTGAPDPGGQRGALDRDLVFRVALAGHRSFQGGAGSGIDVAASAFGGIGLYATSPVGAGDGPAAPERRRSCRLPAGVEVVVAFTGSATATTGFVARWHGLADRVDHGARIAATVERFVDAGDRDDDDALYGAVDDARAAMAAMGEAAGIDVVSAPHRRIADIAHAHGGAAKPSGAGGGDVAVCFVPVGARTSFAEALGSEGVAIVPCRLGVEGVTEDMAVGG
jgi:phosphomevalonate kinase